MEEQSLYLAVNFFSRLFFFAPLLSSYVLTFPTSHDTRSECESHSQGIYRKGKQTGIVQKAGSADIMVWKRDAIFFGGRENDEARGANIGLHGHVSKNKNITHYLFPYWHVDRVDRLFTSIVSWAREDEHE